MRPLLILSLFAIAAAATAQDLGNASSPVVAPQRQGGDTIAEATPIPDVNCFEVTGTTVGYANDYDEACPWANSYAPDVVYAGVASSMTVVTVDLCGSSYDTKLYIYDSDLQLVDCNDDFYTGDPCGIYVSRLDNVVLVGGETYYFVIDGYGGDAGDYRLSVEGSWTCVTECPPGGLPEGEPPLVDDYVDTYNGGCNTSPDHPFQEIAGSDHGEAILCGTAGWYLSGGEPYRDTDWYLLTMGPTGTLTAICDAERSTHFFELAPHDCAGVVVVQNIVGGPCHEATLTISGYAPGAIVWFWAGSTVFEDPGCTGGHYDYVVSFTGLAAAIATEATTWSTVKALYQ